MPGRRPAVTRAQPQGLGFGDEIADRQDEPVVADDDTGPGTLGAEDRGGEGVVRDTRAQPDHGEERALEIEGAIARVRLQLGGDLPIDLL
jgi:hypothetical protein